MQNTTFISALIIIAMAATAGVLFLGIASFFSQGAFYQKHSNKLMRLRVLFQGLALLLFAILMLMRR